MNPITLPCGCTSTEAEILKLAGAITGRRRIGKPSGPGGAGRPRIHPAKPPRTEPFDRAAHLAKARAAKRRNAFAEVAP